MDAAALCGAPEPGVVSRLPLGDRHLRACSGIDTDFDGWGPTPATTAPSCSPTIRITTMEMPAAMSATAPPSTAGAFEVPHELHDVCVGSGQDHVAVDLGRSQLRRRDDLRRDAGMVCELPVGSGVSEICLETGLSDPTAEDPFDPASGIGLVLPRPGLQRLRHRDVRLRLGSGGAGRQRHAPNALIKQINEGDAAMRPTKVLMDEHRNIERVLDLSGADDRSCRRLRSPGRSKRTRCAGLLPRLRRSLPSR